MNTLSDKRQKIEVSMKKAYRRIEEKRGPFCESCKSTHFDHSHNYPRASFPWLIDNEDNITLLCRGEHLAFERNELWLLNNGSEIMTRMIVAQIDETDYDRSKTMWAHFVRKIFAMKDKAEEKQIELPEWCKILIEDYT